MLIIKLIKFYILKSKTMTNLPTKQEWIDFFKFRKKVLLQKIIENSFDEICYNKAVEYTKKTLKKDAVTIDECNKLIDRLDKSLKKKI